MWQSLHDAWWRLATQTHPQSFSDACACRVLQTGSVAYRAAVTVRNAAYDRGWLKPVRLPCRVVSVGNLTVGGTGKTACVELLANKLLATGKRVVVLSRGYGGARRAYWLRWEAGRLTVDGQDHAAHDGLAPFESSRAIRTGLADEPQLLARHLAGVPVVIGRRRDLAGQLACREFTPDVVILDDGFQHRRLARDCEIVLIHARMPFDGWALLPRGPMREPMSALSRAHILMITKADEALETLGALRERLHALNPDAVLVTAVHEPIGLLDVMTGQRRAPGELSGLRVGLLSSIGDPQGFEATVGRLAASVLWHQRYPDHHPYDAADWAALVERSAGIRPDAIVTTEKDWVRLQPFAMDRESLRVPLCILEVRITVQTGDDVLDARLAGLWAR